MTKKTKVALWIVLGALILAFFTAEIVGLSIYKKEKDMVKLDRWGLQIISTMEINHITLTGEKGSEFVCSTSSNDIEEEGTFIYPSTSNSSGTSVTVPNGTTIFWSYLYYDEIGMHTVENDTIWLEFINRKNSKIIGYAVVRVDKIADYNYEAEVVKAVTFPNGKNLTVTEEQVNQLIKNAEK